MLQSANRIQRTAQTIAWITCGQTKSQHNRCRIFLTTKASAIMPATAAATTQHITAHSLSNFSHSPSPSSYTPFWKIDGTLKQTRHSKELWDPQPVSWEIWRTYRKCWVTSGWSPAEWMLEMSWHARQKRIVERILFIKFTATNACLRCSRDVVLTCSPKPPLSCQTLFWLLNVSNQFYQFWPFLLDVDLINF